LSRADADPARRLIGAAADNLDCSGDALPIEGMLVRKGPLAISAGH